MKTKPLKQFDTASDAFDYCREVNKPVTVLIGNGRYRIFPSGHCYKLRLRASESCAEK